MEKVNKEAVVAFLWLLNNTRRIVSAVYTENFNWLVSSYEFILKENKFSKIYSVCERDFDGNIKRMSCSWRRERIELSFESTGETIQFKVYESGFQKLSMILPLINKIEGDLLCIVPHSTEELRRLESCIYAFEQRIKNL